MLDFIKKNLSHDAHPIVQFIKYGLVGGMSTVVHMVVFFICGWFLFPCIGQSDIFVRLLGLTAPEIAEGVRATRAAYSNAIAFIISNIFCYILNVLFVFKPGRHHRVLEFLLFFGVSAISMIIGTVLQSLLIVEFDMQTTLAFGANIFTSLFINYTMRKFFIFQK
ncbi:MAG: GtrA family protein [Kiritimatiellia bacterium]